MICVEAPNRFLSKKPQFSEAFPELTIRGVDQVTLRGDEVGTQRAFINTKSILSLRGGDRR